MTYKILKTEFERELILSLILGLRKNKISDNRAKNISCTFLQTIKSTKDNNEMLEKISKLCSMYPEIIDTYLKVAKKYEDENVKEKLSGMSFYIKVGQVEEALSVLKVNN